MSPKCNAEPDLTLPLPPPGERAAKPPARSGFMLGLLAVAVVLGAAIQLFGPAWTQTIFASVRLDSFSSFAALLVALAASIVLHECGHLVAALLVNFEVLGFCAGPLRATRSYGKWRIEFSGKLFAGSVSAIPRQGGYWRERVLVVVAGGPFVTLLTGIAAGLLVVYGSPVGWPKTFWGGLAELNCFLFVLGLIPNARGARVRNDARLFWVFWSDSSEASEIFLYHLLARLELEGTRPRDYPLGLIRAMAAMRGRTDAMLLYANAISLWALDSGDVVNADAWDLRAVQLSSESSETAQQSTLAKSACLDVLLRRDLTAAEAKLKAVDLDALSPGWLRHRAKAVLYLAIRDGGGALEEICRAHYHLSAGKPYHDFERMLLKRLHREALTPLSGERAARTVGSAA